jgi:hypothetical protein
MLYASKSDFLADKSSFYLGLHYQLKVTDSPDGNSLEALLSAVPAKFAILRFYRHANNYPQPISLWWRDYQKAQTRQICLDTLRHLGSVP